MGLQTEIHTNCPAYYSSNHGALSSEPVLNRDSCMSRRMIDDKREFAVEFAREYAVPVQTTNTAEKHRQNTMFPNQLCPSGACYKTTTCTTIKRIGFAVLPKFSLI